MRKTTTLKQIMVTVPRAANALFARVIELGRARGALQGARRPVDAGCGHFSAAEGGVQAM
ncbi:MAG TPA: hypothetical protein VML91_12200 [Burkholderiales bacterium]|nr:hypothetical protein [Burkholderiales bacterium]